MATKKLLFELFRARVEELTREKGLSEPEKETILQVLRHAMANSYMTEDQIYQELIRKVPE